MLTKFIPAALLLLAALVTTARSPWPLSVAPSTGSSHGPAMTAKSRAPAVAAAGLHTGIHAPSTVAIDDYRMNLQAGVTANAYGLLPLAEHDAARTQSMIDGIAGEHTAPTPIPATMTPDHSGQAQSLLPRGEAAALWLAGLMAVLWMALRRRR